MAIFSRSLFVAIVALAIGFYYYQLNSFAEKPVAGVSSIFDFEVDSGDDDSKVSLANFKGKKAYLVVNVASECGLTNSNYAGMNEIYEKYSSKGLEILAFPCNNFGGQEPGNNDQIELFATNKGAQFPVLGKLECEAKNATETHPLYRFLKNSVSNGILGQGLKWNFAKFLCDSNGVPLKRYLPITNPRDINNDIEKLLNN